MRKLFVVLLLFLATTLSVSANSTASEIIINGDTPWVIAEADYAETSFRMALRNVEKDWYKVFGYPPVIFKNKPSSSWDGPVIVFGRESNFKGVTSVEVPEGKERFRIKATTAGKNPSISALGSDKRGAVYAMYTFTEDFLGIDPMYIFTDSKPKKLKELAIPSDLDDCANEPTFEYRGWFLNDEELHDGLHRDPMGENVIALEWMDKVLESLLRTKGNMIIPESAPYPDASVYDLCKRRDVVITHHHVTPLGLNMMDWPEDLPFSFTENKEILMEAWEKSVKAQADKEVAWIVGFRGKSDGTFWKNDPTAPATDEGRAKVISDAIKAQVEVVRKYDKDGVIVAALWNEVSGFYAQGLLDLPKDVCLMFSDDGRGFMRDNGGELLVEGAGLYYHVMMQMNTQNRSTEGVPPSRFYKELKRYVEKGATKYAIINVSGIRPAAMSVHAMNDFLWDAEPILSKDPMEAQTEYMTEWYSNRFTPELGEKLAALRNEYYNMPHMRDQMPEANKWRGARAEHIFQHSMGDWFRYYGKTIIEGGDITAMKGFEDYYKNVTAITAETGEYIPPLLKKTLAMEKQIPAEHLDFYKFHFTYQVAAHMYSASALVIVNQAITDYVKNGDRKAFAKTLEGALADTEKLIEYAHAGEYGNWDTLFMHVRLMDFWKTRLQIKWMIAEINGEPFTSQRRDYHQGAFWKSAQEYMDFKEGEFPYFFKTSGEGITSHKTVEQTPAEPVVETKGKKKKK